jgi:hypothetical protein
MTPDNQIDGASSGAIRITAMIVRKMAVGA